jgi:isoaspartyl peptidase/L-asparaginase-like protein (Ntn-hydrolase superfamily)
VRSWQQVAHRLRDPRSAAQTAIQVSTKKVDGLAGIVLLSPDDQPGWHHNTPHMARAYRTTDMAEPVAER